tara:strand:+ start:622 stop:798 length:177 start_codon:yes stop_codon:yes gene_type:complete
MGMNLRQAVETSIKSFYKGEPLAKTTEEAGEVLYTLEYFTDMKPEDIKKEKSNDKKNV